MATVTTSHEVQGREGLTLLEAIDQHLVPIPKLLTWDEWRNWRRDYGRRPHGRGQGDESKLWKSTMVACYGPKYLDLIHDRDLALLEGRVEKLAT